MRVFILGGNGMLGHQFLKSWHKNHDVKVSLRRNFNDYNTTLFSASNSFSGIDVADRLALTQVIQHFRPQVVVNAIGVTKQLTHQNNVLATIQTNALFPHQLADMCAQYEARLIHLSTDCVFSGQTGFYCEQDNADATDLYGRSKLLGEVNQTHVVTLRKSTIGLELAGGHGLIAWFLSQRGTVKGYNKAIYSGLIASELANVIEDIFLNQPTLHGLWHVASEPIDKYDLLTRLAQRLNLHHLNIVKDESFICDRSLNAKAFSQKTAYVAPTWDTMLDKLAIQIEEHKNDLRK